MFALVFSLAVLFVFLLHCYDTTASEEELPVKRKLTAWIHIGNSKTGTTHIQSYIRAEAKTILQEGLIAEAIPPKQAKSFAQPEKIAKLINHAAAEKKDLFLSSELMRNYRLEHVQQLKKYLIEASFDKIFIIWGFREPLSRAISDYNQMSHTLFPPSLSSYMPSHMRILPTLAIYASVFGTESIQVLDYYGILASPVDIIHVVLCEIIGYYCDTTIKLKALLSSRGNNENQSRDYTYLPLFHHIISATEGHIRQEGKILKDSVFRRTGFELSIKKPWNFFYHYIQKSEVSLPIQEVNLTLYHYSAKAIYDEIKELYKNYQWFYYNETANIIARNQVHYEELAIWDMLKETSWRQYIQELITIMKENGFNHICE